MLLDCAVPRLDQSYQNGCAERVNELVLFRRNLPESNFTIRVATSDEDLIAAEQIINRLYGWRGYGAQHTLTRHESRTTFIAAHGADTLGTLTLSVDSTDGLNVDASFPEELAGLRERGASVCELTKFAFDPSAQSKPLLAILFHTIFTYGTHHHSCTDLLIEVNPRHVRFYEAALGFQKLGGLKTNTVVNAPSQLMRLPVCEIEDNIERFAGEGPGSNHSLYRHFLRREDARTLQARIAAVYNTSSRLDRSNVMPIREVPTASLHLHTA
jgi:hypothetical protein